MLKFFKKKQQQTVNIYIKYCSYVKVLQKNVVGLHREMEVL